MPDEFNANIDETKDKVDTSKIKDKKIIRSTTAERGEGQAITDSFGSVRGVGQDSVETLEWVPAYYCELTVIKSPLSKKFTTSYTENIYKKRRIRKDKFLGQETHVVRANLSEIRGGTLRNKMQDLINLLKFECKLPNQHVIFGKEENCFGKIIAEKIPRVLYHIAGEGPTIKYVLVREHERALFTRSGKILSVLEAGKHDIVNRSKEFDVVEIYYVDVGNVQTKWGTSTMITDGKGTMTATQVKLRLNGSVVSRVNNLNNFIPNLVKNETEYYEGNLQNYVKDKLLQIINSEMSQSDPISIYQDAEKVMLAVKVKANKFFQDVGVEIVDLSVASCKFDEEVEQMFKARLEKIKVGGATEDADTERKMQELKRLQEMGIDVSTYVSKEQDIKMAAAGGASEKERIEKEIAELEEKMEDLDDSLDSGKISETVWEKRTERIEKKIEELKSNL